MMNFLNLIQAGNFFYVPNIFSSFSVPKSFMFPTVCLLSVLLYASQLEAQTNTFAEARKAYNESKYDQASEKIKEKLATSEDAAALLLAAEIHTALAAEDSFRSEHVEQAARFYDEAIIQSAENTSLYLESQIKQEKFWQKIMKQAATYEEKKNYTAAHLLLNKAKLVLPQNVDTYLLAGKLAFAMKNYAAAEDNFTYLIDSLNYEGKQVQEILNSLLTVSLLQDSTIEAESRQVLEVARETEGDSIDAQRMQIELLISKGKMDFAEQWMDSLDLNEQEQAGYYHQIGGHYQADERPEQAIIYFKKALNKDASLADARYLLSISYQQLARNIMKADDNGTIDEKSKQKASSHLENARQQLRKLQQLQPDYPLLNYTLKDVNKTLERLS